jgi:hypothetical protein
MLALSSPASMAVQQHVVAAQQLAPERGVAARPGLLECEALQRDAHGVDLAHVVRGQGRDMRAGVGHGDQQTFFDQLPHRLAQGPAADVELLGQRGFHQGRAGRNLAAQDGCAQLVGDVVAESAFGQARRLEWRGCGWGGRTLDGGLHL